MEGVALVISLEKNPNFLKFRTGCNFLYAFHNFQYTCPGKLQDMCRKVYRKLRPVLLQEKIYRGHDLPCSCPASGKLTFCPVQLSAKWE